MCWYDLLLSQIRVPVFLHSLLKRLPYLLPELFRRGDFDIVDELEGPVFHGGGAGVQADFHVGVVLFEHADVFAEPFDDLVDDGIVGDKCDAFGFVGEEVGHRGGKLFVVDAALIAFDGADLDRRVLRPQLDVRHVIQAVEDHIFKVAVVGHQIIALVVEDHLVGADALVGRIVQLFVRPVLVVIVADHHTLLDGLIDDFDVVEQFLVLRLAPVIDRENVLHMGFEVFVGLGAEALDQVFGMLRVDVFATQDAVDQHPKLRVLEIPAMEIHAAPAGIDLDARLPKKGQIPCDGLPFNHDAVVTLQAVRNVLLRHRVVAVALLPEDLQDP